MTLNKFSREAASLFWSPVHSLLRGLQRPRQPEAFGILAFHHLPKPQHHLFERLLKYVTKKYGVITPEEAEARLKGNFSLSAKKAPFLLTFDDGFNSQAAAARDILNKYGIKAVFFICPGLIEISAQEQRELVAKRVFDPPKAAADIREDLLPISWDELKSLAAQGHSVGAHTMFHRRLSCLNNQELSHELYVPAQIIENKLGLKVKWFAYPFGDISNVNEELLTNLGKQYNFACTTLRGMNSSKTHPLKLFRQGVDLTASFGYQKMILAGGLDFIYKKNARR